MSDRVPATLASDKSGIITYIPLLVATLFTGFFGLYVWSLAQEWVVLEGVHKTRFAHFLAGAPNAMGDTLAGFVGSLTLIWVVASVVQQSIELRAQRLEFAEMVRAQEAQVKALNAQASIFEDEKKRRDEDEAQRVFEIKVRYVNHELQTLTTIQRVIEVKSALEEEPLGYRDEYLVVIADERWDGDTTFKHFADQIFGVAMAIRDQVVPGQRVVAIDGLSHLTIREMSARADSLMQSEPFLSESQKARFHEMRVSHLSEGLAYLAKRADLWAWEKENKRWWKSP